MIHRLNLYNIRHALLIHPLNTPCWHTLSIDITNNLPHQHNQSTQPIKTPTQHTQSTHHHCLRHRSSWRRWRWKWRWEWGWIIRRWFGWAMWCLAQIQRTSVGFAAKLQGLGLNFWCTGCQSGRWHTLSIQPYWHALSMPDWYSYQNTQSNALLTPCQYCFI